MQWTRTICCGLGHKISLLDTDESYGMVEITSPPHVPIQPPHFHKSENEFFFIIQGTLDFMSNGEWQNAPPEVSLNSSQTRRIHSSTTPSRMLYGSQAGGRRALNDSFEISEFRCKNYLPRINLCRSGRSKCVEKRGTLRNVPARLRAPVSQCRCPFIERAAA